MQTTHGIWWYPVFCLWPSLPINNYHSNGGSVSCPCFIFVFERNVTGILSPIFNGCGHHSFFFLIYLKVRAWTICWFIPEMVIMTRAGSGWIIWVYVGAGDQALGLSSAAFSGKLTGSWIRSGGVRTWVGVHMGFCHHRHHRQQFNLYHGANHNIIVQQSSPTLCGIY